MKRIIAIAILLVFLGCAAPEKPKNGNVIEINDSIKGIDKENCEQAGGKWNECGSPCAGTGADFCIQMCEAMCECGGILKCPEGYACRLSGKIADETGKCIEVAKHERQG